MRLPAFVPAWRAAFRIARRDALRARRRSALAVAMIALPVLGVTAADVTYRSVQPDLRENLTWELGTADACFSDPGFGPGPIVQSPDAGDLGLPDGADTDRPRRPLDMAAVLPHGARTVSSQDVSAMVSTGYGAKSGTIRELPTSDRMMSGKVRLDRGRFPEPGARDEMAATPAFLSATGLRIGSSTRVEGLGRSFRITGAVELPGQLDEEVLFAEPGAVIEPWRRLARRDRGVVPPHPEAAKYYVDMPGHGGVDWRRVRAANREGALVESRQVLLHPPPADRLPRMDGPDGPRVRITRDSGDLITGAGATATTLVVATVIALVVLEIVLLAGPAFAVGARRARRQLGLLGICGGDHRHVRAVVLAGGVLLGGVGAVLGVLAGLGLTVVCRPLIEDWTGTRFGSLEIRPLEILLVAALGVVTGALAALSPAILAGRQSVLESLTGRRGVRRASRALPLLGLAAILFGVMMAGVAALTRQDPTLVGLGSVIAELGALACIPVIVGACGRLGGRLPLVFRLALRDAARNRGRTAPAVAAVMAAVAGSIAVATYDAGKDTQDRVAYQPMLRPGTAAVIADPYATYDSDLSRLMPSLRAAAERTLPVTGERADVSRVWHGRDCYPATGSEPAQCGSLELVKPAEHACPLLGGDGRDLAQRLHADAHRRLLHSPECVDEYGYTDAIGVDDQILAGDAKLLHTYVGLHDPAADRALAEGRPVLLNRAYAKDGRITLRRYDTDAHAAAGRPDRVSRLAAYVAPARYAGTPGVRLVLPPRLVHRLGLRSAPAGSLFALARTPSHAEEQRAGAALGQGGMIATLYVERGYQGRDETLLIVLSLFAAVVTVGAAAISTGLAKADAEPDLATLSAVGAPPWARRSLSGVQSAVISGLGVLLGVAAGVVPAVALRLAEAADAMDRLRADPLESAYTPIELPWGTIGALTVGVPLFAGLLAAGCTRSRTSLLRRAGE
ncbi:hypothetical protein ACZ90_54730 [Streptomyces albus subsp. albus]|nr:hypothetical protein ACZ90_54730 [Streptomyces albus subsp. albus]